MEGTVPWLAHNRGDVGKEGCASLVMIRSRKEKAYFVDIQVNLMYVNAVWRRGA